ncbi:flagellar biosynthetic protein FliR [Roseateles sp. P5_E1]
MPSIDPAWAVAVLLLWARLGALLTLSPLAQAVKAPPIFWVLFTLALSGSLCAALGLRTPVPAGLGGLFLLLLSEAALGALLGLSLHAAFAALAMAGRLLDLQMGFGMATVLDPVTRANVPVMGVALTLVGMSVFFGVDGHHALLRGIAQVAQWVPPGALWRLPDASALARAMGAMFSMTVVLVAPAMFMLLLIELVLDFVSRVLPQMNVLFIGMPVKALVGLSTLAIAAPGMAPALRRLYASVFDFWQVVQP